MWSDSNMSDQTRFNCCCRFFLAGWIDLLLSAASHIIPALQVILIDTFISTKYPNEANYFHDITIFMLKADLLRIGTGFIFTVFLIIGSVMHYHVLLLPWLLYNGILLVIFGCLMFWGVFLTAHLLFIHGINHLMSTLLLWIIDYIVFGFWLCIWFVVRSMYKQFHDTEEEVLF